MKPATITFVQDIDCPHIYRLGDVEMTREDIVLWLDCLGYTIKSSVSNMGFYSAVREVLQCQLTPDLVVTTLDDFSKLSPDDKILLENHINTLRAREN
jgi:hypothetical protein